MHASLKRRVSITLAVLLCLLVLAGILLHPFLWRYSAYQSVRHAIEAGNEKNAIRQVQQLERNPLFDANWTVTDALPRWRVVRRLYEWKVGCPACKGEWRTLLQHAGMHGQSRLVVTLIASGGSVSYHGDQGFWALNAALGSEDTNTVALLLRHGAHINALSPIGSVMHLAAASIDRLDVLEFLIASGANLNAVDSKGWTPLDWAAVWNTNAVPLLVAHGAKPGENRRVPLPAPGWHKRVSN